MYKIESIISSRITKQGKKQYLIKWHGYDDKQNTWESERNLSNAKELLRKF
jgi:hypothetical protein